MKLELVARKRLECWTNWTHNELHYLFLWRHTPTSALYDSKTINVPELTRQKILEGGIVPQLPSSTAHFRVVRIDGPFSRSEPHESRKGRIKEAADDLDIPAHG